MKYNFLLRVQVNPSNKVTFFVTTKHDIANFRHKLLQPTEKVVAYEKIKNTKNTLGLYKQGTNNKKYLLARDMLKEVK